MSRRQNGSLFAIVYIVLHTSDTPPHPGPRPRAPGLCQNVRGAQGGASARALELGGGLAERLRAAEGAACAAAGGEEGVGWLGV